ncbi:MAG: MBL fold metallo-hydrolase [Candidatus Lokiarchaeota archaeon]|nr:MBL fold metallo-hydrolase [Candidatus Lokiarchaeota archaeon]MBD3200402.1 MBL fold metallo-hydrolase [Candidatus Lokiarchaeota archaeon]
MVVRINRYENEQIIEWKWASDNQLIPSPFFTSCFIIEDILIDTGAPASTDELKSFLEKYQEERMINKCIITHIHEDHSGGASMIQKNFQIPLFAHSKAIPILKNKHNYPQYRKMTWGEERLPVNAEKIPNLVDSSSRKYEFEVLHMPGHAPGLIALIERSKQWVFTSDAVQSKYKMIFGANSDIQEDISLIYKSISNLYNITAGMNNLKIFSSGQGVFKGREFLKEKLMEIKSLQKQVHTLFDEFSEKYEKDEKIYKKVLRELFGRETVIGKLTKEDLSTMNLIKSLKKWEL